MKRIMLGIMVVMMLLSLVLLTGCGTDRAPEAQMETSGGDTALETEQTQVPETTAEKQANSYVREDLGFSLNPGKLMVDEDIDDDVVLTLTHLSGDKAKVSIKEPDKLIDDPVTWLKRENAFEGYKVYRDEVKKINGYQARVSEYDFNATGRTFRVVDLTAYKEGYFYTLLVMMDPAYLDDTRTEFDKVVDSFALSEKTIDVANLELWRAEVPEDFPFDAIPFYRVERIYSVFGKSMAESGYLTVGYDVKEGENKETVIAFYDDILKGTPGYKKYSQMDDTIMQGTLKGYEAEAKVGDATSKGQVRVYLRMKKPK